jgi:nitrogen fixation-related uncharacterized protein
MSNATGLFVIGGIIILVGLGFFLWGRREARQYEEGLASRYDLREFMEHTPERPEPGALKIGGVIGMALGLVMVVTGFFLR